MYSKNHQRDDSYKSNDPYLADLELKSPQKTKTGAFFLYEIKTWAFLEAFLKTFLEKKIIINLYKFN